MSARPLPVCADESAHGIGSLAALVGKYDAVNIKLDKAGGLTEALAMAQEAERLGFSVMIGCMVATSLAMAPAMLVAQRARYVDLDGPLLLRRDRPNGLLLSGQQRASADRRALGLTAAKGRYAAAGCRGNLCTAAARAAIKGGASCWAGGSSCPRSPSLASRY